MRHLLLLWTLWGAAANNSIWGVPCVEGGSCPFGPHCEVCGNYCGPGWCGGDCVAEGPACDYAVRPLCCTDACCRYHDVCCGCDPAKDPGCDLTNCNRELVECLRDCPPWHDCPAPDGHPWSARVIEDVFHTLEMKRCCGQPC